MPMVTWKILSEITDISLKILYSQNSCNSHTQISGFPTFYIGFELLKHTHTHTHTHTLKKINNVK
jgi:hypothetical protein